MGTEKSKATAKKVMDISKPNQVAASPTSRPVIVTNRPLIAKDPMVAGKEDAETVKPAEAKPTAPLTPHTEKIIEPLRDGGLATEQAVEPDKGTKKPGENKQPSTTQETSEMTGSENLEDETAVASKEQSASGKQLVDSQADAAEHVPAATSEESIESEEAAEEADEVLTDSSTTSAVPDDTAVNDGAQIEPGAAQPSPAEQKRTEEIEAAIASGKYFVPINASGKRRTRIATLWLVVLAVVLGVVLVDALLDVGILSIPGVPHTHFFSLT